MNLRSIFLALMLCVGGVAMAQISISQEQFATLFSVGTNFTIDSGIVSAAYNVGAPGSSAQTFDFSSVMFKANSINGTIVNAATTADIASFPGATLALEEAVSGVGVSYEYMGIVAGQGLVDYGADAAGTKLVTAPPDLFVKLPLAYGTSWTYYSDTIKSVITAGTIIDTSKRFTVKTRSIDAFGTIKIGANSYACLREKEVDVLSQTNTFAGIPGNTASTVFYNYVMADGSGFTVSINTADSTATSLTPKSISYRHAPTTAVKESSALPDGLSLVAMYPNPLRDNATVEYTLSEYATVRVDIVDMLGRTLGTIINSPQSAGHYGVALNAATLPAGTYNCRVSVNGNISNHLMHVVK